MSLNPGELHRLLHGFRRLFAAVAGFSLVINLLMLAPALYMLQVYDRVLLSGNRMTLLMLTVVLLGVFALEALLEWVRGRALVRCSSALDLLLAPKAFDAVFRRGLQSGGGMTAQSLGDVTHLRQFLTGNGLFAFLDAPFTPLYLAVIFLLHPVLGLFALATSVLLLGLAWANEKLTAATLLEAGRLSQQAGQYASTQLRNAETIEAMGMLAGLRRQWLALHQRALGLQAQASDHAVDLAALTRWVRMVAQSGVLGVGALLVIDGQLSSGGMIAASILLGRALAPVDQAVGQWRSLVSARGAYRRLRELLDAYPPAPSRLALPRPQGAVQVESLTVGAPGAAQAVLKGIGFSVAPGTTVVVLGASASGKSTLAKALVGVWPPMSGSVRLDGEEVHRWDREALGPWVGYLPQDVELFDGSVAENIARFGPIQDEWVVSAAQFAGVHELILRLPEGYETRIGRDGWALSGGQRQRIALARAVYGAPALLVFDEPDAGLDEAGGIALVSALQHLKSQRRTVFLVTHRRSLVELADQVLVLAGGRLQAFGPRQEVMERLRASGSAPLPAASDVLKERA